MKPAEARAHLKRINISARAFARLVGMSEDHFRHCVRDNAKRPLPPGVEVALYALTSETARDLIEERMNQ